METMTTKVSLASMSEGAAIERFDEALDEVLRNVLDPNTDARAKRSVTLKVTITPEADRSFGKVEIDCWPTLAKNQGIMTQVFIGRSRTGEIGAYEVNQVQQELPFNVTFLRKEGNDD